MLFGFQFRIISLNVIVFIEIRMMVIGVGVI